MSELPRATRSYVVLGLLFLVSIALAVREYVLGSRNRGAPDEWSWVLLVSDYEQPWAISWSTGLDIDTWDVDDTVEFGRELLDNPDASPIVAAIAAADESGYGFLLLDLRQDWDLSPLGVEAPPGSRYTAISIGDVAREGTRVNFGAPMTGPFAYIPDSNPIHYASEGIDVVAIELALFEHPDLRALFDGGIEGPESERSRWSIEQYDDHEQRRGVLQAQQRRLAEVDELWPREPMPGALASRWEHVRAVPVLGGVIVESFPVWLDVQRTVHSAQLHRTELGELAFVPNAALELGRDAIEARRPCVGLHERAMGADEHGWSTREFEARESNLGVSPDGRLLVVHRGTNSGYMDVYRIVSGSADACELDWLRLSVPGTRGRLEPSNSGELSSAYGYWTVDPHSGPWWSSDNLLVALGGRARAHASEAAVMFLRTGAAQVFDESGLRAPNARFDARTLFPRLSTEDPAATLIDVRPVGPDTLMVVTQACPASHAIGDNRRQRPCLHRVRLRTSLDERLGSEPISIARKQLEVRTLGPIDSYRELAIAADGTRAVYATLDPLTFEPAPDLFAVEIEADGLLPSDRHDAKLHPESTLSISADGCVVVVENPVVVGKYGELPSARAFALPR